jgi:tripartite ATP-independent transporter DctP family solute receptor
MEKRPPLLAVATPESGFYVSVHLVAILGVLVLLAASVLWWLVFKPLEPESPVMPAPANKMAPEARILRLGLNIAAGSALHEAAVRFSDLVGERSGGKLKVTVHPDQQLGNDDQMLEMTRDGRLDLVLTPTAKLSSAIPAMQYADLPFYFSGREELYAMLDGEPGQMLLSKMSSIDLVGLTFWENGFKQFTSNTPIHSPQDFAKLRIRTMKSRLIADQFETLGAQAIPIDFHATYQALADGAVDGQENPLVAIVGMRFHEVQKHLTLSNHAYLGYAFSVSKRVFETLSPDMRDVIQRAARELTVWEREETARREAKFIETIHAAGVEVYTLSPEERRRFSTALAPIADKFGFEVGYDLLAKTEQLRYAKQEPASAPGGRTPLLIGLDADLSSHGAQGGGAIYRGVQLAVEEINRKGGLLGAPLRMIARDHGANPEIGRQNLEHFAAMSSLLAVVGGVHTPVIIEELEDIHRLRIPYLIPWAAGDGLTAHEYRPSYTFRVSSTDSEIAPFLLERALKLIGGGHAAFLLERSAWGRSNEAVLTPLIENLPAGSVEMDWVTAGDPGIEARIDALARHGTRTLIMVTNPAVSGAIVQAMARQDKPLPILAHWGLTASDFWKQEQAALQRVDLRFVQTVLIDEAQNRPQLKKFIARYRERYGLGPDDPVPSPIGTLQAYDLTHLLARAVMQAKSTNREAVRAALETLRPYSGVIRDYNPPFTKERHDALNGLALHLARFDAHGRIVRAE